MKSLDHCLACLQVQSDEPDLKKKLIVMFTGLTRQDISKENYWRSGCCFLLDAASACWGTGNIMF